MTSPARHRGYVPGTHGQYAPARPWKPLYAHMFEESLVRSDFTETTGPKQAEGVQAIAGGAGASVLGSFTEDLSDHPGIWVLNTGSTAVGRVFIISGSITGWHVGRGGVTRVGTWYKTEANLSTAIERYTLRAGFFSVVLPNTLVHGIGFEYDDSQNGGRWHAITR